MHEALVEDLHEHADRDALLRVQGAAQHIRSILKVMDEAPDLLASRQAQAEEDTSARLGNSL